MKSSRTGEGLRGPGRRGDPTLVGRGRSTAHLGEILQGVFAGPGDQLHQALVTLPCRTRGSEARFFPEPGKALTVRPPGKTKALRAASLALSQLGLCDVLGGVLEVSGNVPEGWGMGSSTSDVAANVRAVFGAFGETPSPERVARLAAEAEVACDPVMFDDRALLFAHRRGEALEDLGGPLPPMEVVAFGYHAHGVKTLDLPPIVYDEGEISSFAAMLRTLRAAVLRQDVGLVGKVASQSARINQRHRPKPGFGSIPELAAACDAAGFNVAHSGSAGGLLFDAKDGEVLPKVVEAQRVLSGLGMRPWTFRAP